VIDGDGAHVLSETLFSGINDETGRRWWDWGRGMDHCKKENDNWKYYGSQIRYKRNYVNVTVQNTPEEAEHVGIKAEFIDCATQQYIADVSVVESLILTGPPDTYDAEHIENSWYEDQYWRGFTRRDPTLENATSGFYTFRVEEAGTGNFLDFTDYLQFSPSMDLPTLISPDDDWTISGDQVQLTWNPVDRAKLYSVDVNVYNENTQTWDRLLSTDPSPYPYVSVTGLTYSADFQWRVRAIQNDLYGEIDNESTSDWREFSTPPPPT
jgi:hypothetical protein